MRVDNSARSGGIIRISLIFCYMKVYCVFTLESPHRGDSNEYTQYTIFQYEKEKHPKLSQICSYGNFSKGLKNEFERAVVNEPSVFEPLKFYCNYIFQKEHTLASFYRLSKKQYLQHKNSKHFPIFSFVVPLNILRKKDVFMF